MAIQSGGVGLIPGETPGEFISMAGDETRTPSGKVKHTDQLYLLFNNNRCATLKSRRNSLVNVTFQLHGVIERRATRRFRPRAQSGMTFGQSDCAGKSSPSLLKRALHPRFQKPGAFRHGPQTGGRSSFLDEDFEPLGACLSYGRAGFFLPGHSVPAPFFNEFRPLPRI
jgi:hypothetical protein